MVAKILNMCLKGEKNNLKLVSKIIQRAMENEVQAETMRLIHNLSFLASINTFKDHLKV